MPTKIRRGRALATLCALTLLFTWFGAAATTGAADPLPAFYDVPDPLPAGGPGTVIKTEPVTLPGLHGTLQRVMYKSASLQGNEIAVTGLITTPSTPAPPGGYPVLDWEHGTVGMADACAPSLSIDANTLPAANVFLDRGWVVVASDYEGLGTPVLHPYIVGESEARGAIDIVRAARDLDPDVSNRFLAWGHSQGGHATLFTGHIPASWAPELKLVGVVAGAHPSQLSLVYDFLRTSPYKFYVLMVAGAINAAYGDMAAPLDAVANPDGIAMLPLLDEGCSGALAAAVADRDIQDLMVQQADGSYNPFSNPIWGPLIAAQDAANFTEPFAQPLLIVHGGADEQIPSVSSVLLADQLCRIGQNVERWEYPGRSHSGVVPPSLESMVGWMTARFDGEATPGPLAAGQDDVVDTLCVDGAMVTRTATSPEGTGAPDGAVPEPGDHTGEVTPATPVTARPAYTG